MDRSVDRWDKLERATASSHLASVLRSNEQRWVLTASLVKADGPSIRLSIRLSYCQPRLLSVRGDGEEKQPWFCPQS